MFNVYSIFSNQKNALPQKNEINPWKKIASIALYILGGIATLYYTVLCMSNPFSYMPLSTILPENLSIVFFIMKIYGTGYLSLYFFANTIADCDDLFDYFKNKIITTTH